MILEHLICAFVDLCMLIHYLPTILLYCPWPVISPVGLGCSPSVIND